eukprot:COSAG01_NODE_942_length_12551_cov_47.129216_9_plen_122_part_00
MAAVDSPPPLRAPTPSWRRRHGWRFSCASPRCRCQLMPAHATPAVADCELPTSHRARCACCVHALPTQHLRACAPRRRPLRPHPLGPATAGTSTTAAPCRPQRWLSVLAELEQLCRPLAFT